MEIPSLFFILLFLPLSLAGYYVLSFSKPLKNAWLILMSLVFYGWGEPAVLLFLFAMAGFHYLAGLILSRVTKKTPILFLVIGIDCLVFWGCKNLEPVQTIWNMVIGNVPLQLTQWIVPLGIAFMVLRGISYVVDIAVGTIKADKNPFFVLFYLSFFPLVAAGPWIAYKDFIEQAKNRHINTRKFSVGCTRFVQGLGKKVIFADNLSHVSELVFNWSRLGIGNMSVPVLTAWLGILAFTLQIYLELSGYCDMAIGLGMMFGFDFPENFDFPYMAGSITAFWKKWNITLTNWFRTYVFEPLGGENSENGDLVVRNLALTCMLFALWHGQNWGILLCALLHFVFLVLERFMEKDFQAEHSVVIRIYTIFVVIVGFVLFYAHDIYQAYIYLRNMFGLNHCGLADVRSWFLLREYWVFYLAGLLLCAPISRKANTFLVREESKPFVRGLSILYPLVMLALFFLSLSYCSMTTGNALAYF